MKTHNDSRTLKAANRKKAQAALALAVSLWMAGGGVASAQEIVVAEDYNDSVYGNTADPNDKTQWPYVGITPSNPNNNKVTVNAGVTVTGFISGSLHKDNDVTGNEVIVNGTVISNVIGGESESANAQNNIVTINGSVGNDVYGGYTSTGIASGNRVTINGTVNQDVYGGHSWNGAATENCVMISGGTINGAVRGGSGKTGANDNTVTISGGTMKSLVMGGYIDGSGTATGNKVIMTGGSAQGKVLGANLWEGKSATNNQVTVSGGTISGDELAGAYSSDTYPPSSTYYDAAHDVSNNTVTVKDSANIQADIDGAVTNNGKADSNHVIIEDGTVNKDEGYGHIYGGRSNGGGYATNNTVTISGGTVTARVIVGGSAKGGNATGNTVTVSSDVTGAVYGGDTAGGTGDATGNKVTLKGATAKVTGDVCGGYTVGGTNGVTGNIVTLDGAKVTGGVYGGYAKGGSGAVTGNIVTLNGATVTGNVYGGGTGTGEEKGTGDLVKGNTLNLFSANSASGVVGNFEKIVLQNSLDVKYYDGTEEKIATYSLTWQDGATLLSAKKFENYGTLDISGATMLKDRTTPGSMTLLSSDTEDNFANLPLKYWDGKATLTAANPSVEVFRAAKSDADSGVTLDYNTLHTVAVNAADSYKTVTYNVRSDAKKLTFGDVEWKDTGALIDHKTKWADVDFNGADVDTTKISFTNLQTLDTDSKMTLVSDFGTSAGTINGSTFTVGKGTGEGYAYFESGNLRYLVTKGVTEPEPEPGPEPEPEPEPGPAPSEEIIDEKVEGDVEPVKAKENETAQQQEKIVEKDGYVTGNVTTASSKNGKSQDNIAAVNGGKVGGSVTGAEVTGSGDATTNHATVTGGSVGGNVTGATTKGGVAASNTATVSNGGTVGAADNPANLTGATTESGEAKENAANVTGGKVIGDVAGAVTGSGDATGNTATVTGGGTVTGSNPEETFAVAGARTESGAAEGNKAMVGENSTVMGAVVGAVVTGGALADGNAANITGGSTVTGDVMGSFVDTGNITGNTANVEKNSTVNGDILGAYSTDGDAVANHAVVSDSTVNANTQSECDGDVTGAQTENGVASGNTATVTGSKVAGQVVGGIISQKGEANSNEAHVSGGAVGYGVYGGLSARGNVTGNTATVDGGATVSGEVKGGETDVGDASGNKATVTDSVIGGDVYGGYSGKGTANDNAVEISGKTEVNGTVYGGKSTEKSEGNKVTLAGGTVNKIVGGGCKTGANNIVTISGGTVHEVYGAEAGKSATGNQIVLSGGTVDGVLYGGFSDSQTGTVNNVITLYGDADVSNANIFGGNGADATGNVLVIGLKDSDVLSNSTAWTGGTVRNLSNLETIRLDVVKWGTPALTITDGKASDLSKTTVDATKIQFIDVQELKVNETMTLLDDSILAPTKRVKDVKAGSDFTVGTTTEGMGSLSLENGKVVYKVATLTSSKRAHSAVMGLEAGMAALAVGNDFIGDATAGLGLAANTGADGVSTFAKFGGGKMRQQTGSHVDVNTWNAIIALGKKNQGEKSSFEYGAFFEYGSGNYTTHNGDARGDGSASYTGGGLMAKWTANHGFYVEGSLRAGTVKDDAKNVMRDGAGVPYSYDTSAGYFGAHLGVGKEIALANGNTVDVYGKYFYNRRSGVSFNAGGHYDLDAVTSQILRVGARYTVKRDKWNFYAGAAYEHELDGKATGTAGGLAIRGAEISGASFRGELGATMKPDEKSPWSLDLNVAGFAGKKQGFTGGVSVAFMF